MSYQLPNKSIMVHYLLDRIKCTNPALLAKITNIQCDQDSNRKQHDFEKAVAFILPAFLVALCLARGELIVVNKTAEISIITLDEGIGQSGVKL